MRRRLEPYRLPLIGVTFLVILVGMLAAAIVDYSGGFTPRTRVSLVVPNAGNQLGVGAQVKLHGAIVGAVEKIEAHPDGARLTLALDPDDTDLIPADVLGRVLPKTLVGQNYVDLVLPTRTDGGGTATAASRRIADGDVIARDASARTVELETALDSLLEVLDAVPPQQVASTLNAVATALEGRGEQLGTTISSLQSYLSRFNESLPELNEDIRLIAEFSRTYRDAAPDLLAAFDDLSTTTTTIADERERFADTYTSVAGAARDTRRFLDDNGDNFTALTSTAIPTLETLARYAPQFPCFFDQLSTLVPRINEIFNAGTDRPRLSITARITNSRGRYVPNQDEPAYLDDRGPRCYPIVPIAPQYPDGVPIADGSVAPGAPKAATPPSVPAARTGAPTAGSATGAGAQPARGGVLSGLLGLLNPGKAVAR